MAIQVPPNHGQSCVGTSGLRCRPYQITIAPGKTTASCFPDLERLPRLLVLDNKRKKRGEVIAGTGICHYLSTSCVVWSASSGLPVCIIDYSTVPCRIVVSAGQRAKPQCYWWTDHHHKRGSIGNKQSNIDNKVCISLFTSHSHSQMMGFVPEKSDYIRQ